MSKASKANTVSGGLSIAQNIPWVYFEMKGLIPKLAGIFNGTRYLSLNAV